jgi:hypothetical protein
MSLIASTQSEDFELTPSGTIAGICYRVIDIGTQQSEYQGQVKRAKKITLSWELPSEKMADGQRVFSIHKRYTLSLHEKAVLRKDLESWRGVPFTDDELKGFDIRNLLGKPCLLGIVHEESKGKTYANISSILKLPKGMPAPEPVNTPVQFDLSEFDQTVYDSLSDSLKATIAKSPEYQELKGGHKTEPNTVDGREFAPPDATLSEEVPF